jgi:hypothetical protein
MNLHLKHCVAQLPEIEDLIEQCKLVVRRFSNVCFARQLLRDNVKSYTRSDQHPLGRTLEMYKPGDTRFGTNYRMFDRILDVKRCLQAIVL